VQRLELLIAVMLARERRAPTADGYNRCTPLAAALAALPSRPLETIADAVAALGYEDIPSKCTAAATASKCTVQ
jgi:hypothetical protein